MSHKTNLENILSLTRRGLTAPGVYGQIDDITATFSGNQLASLRDDAPTVLLESSLDIPEGSWAGPDFSYDANGNQTRDMSRGVAAVEYNDLNLPRRVEFASGGRIEYLYSAVGTKLAEIITPADGYTQNMRRDYVGQFMLSADSIVQVLFTDGFVTLKDSVFHTFIYDYQGNIAGVHNSQSNKLEQVTDFYPYGLPHASVSFKSSSANRYKFGAKELSAELGLDMYDFTARWLNSSFPNFTSLDLMCEQKKWNSGYIFCSSDPINFIDPTGLDEFEVNSNGSLVNRIENKDYDVVYVVDASGKRIHESPHYQYGTLDVNMGLLYQPEIGPKQKYSYILIKDFATARSLFEFFSAYTNVEWIHCEYMYKNGDHYNVLTTSHKTNHNSGLNYFLIENQEGNNTAFIIALKRHIHNHPSGVPIPSGMIDYKGDIYNAMDLSSAYSTFPIQFEVYSAKHNCYVSYNWASRQINFIYYLIYFRNELK